MRIAIVGAGGVGGYFGGRLAAAGADVTFLARGAHLDAMRARGLRITSPKGDLHLPRVKAESDPRAIGPVDVVVLRGQAVRHRRARCAMLPPLVGPDTIVVGFQNGVETVASLTRAVGASHTAGGVSYVSAVIAEPGVIQHTAMDHLIFGMPDGSRLAAARGAARGLPPRRFSVDAEPGHHRRHLDQVRAPLGLQRHDRGDAQPDRRHRQRSGAARDAEGRGARDAGGRARQRRGGRRLRSTRMSRPPTRRCRRRPRRRCSRTSSAAAGSSCRG